MYGCVGVCKYGCVGVCGLVGGWVGVCGLNYNVVLKWIHVSDIT